MEPHFSTYIGIDLGGARGKTTAVARLSRNPRTEREVVVEEVCTRRSETEPWRDAALLDYVCGFGDTTVVAIDAALSAPACVRCHETTCPGQEECVDPAVVWLRTVGAAAGAIPYVHRCSEIQLHHERGLISRDAMGKGTGPVAARAAHLGRVLLARGFELNHSLIEVSPRATVQSLFGPKKARGYKRDADPWETRASIIDGLDDLRFALSSRLAKESALRNDHCFEALLSGYTAYLRSRDRWKLPEEAAEVFTADGWIWAPEK